MYTHTHTLTHIQGVESYLLTLEGSLTHAAAGDKVPQIEFVQAV